MTIAAELDLITRLQDEAIGIDRDGDPRGAEALLDEAIARCADLTARTGASPPAEESTRLSALHAELLHNRAIGHARNAAWGPATRCLHDAAATVGALDSAPVASRHAEAWAFLETARGNEIAALPWAERAAELAVGPEPRVTTLASLAQILTVLGQYDRAEDAMARALPLASALGDEDLVHGIRLGRAVNAAHRGDRGRAARLLEELLAANPSAGTAARASIDLAMLVDDPPLARHHVERALRLARAHGLPEAEADAVLGLGLVENDDATALALFDRARELLRDAPAHRAIADHAQAAWMASRHRDDPEWARTAVGLVLPAALALDTARIGLRSGPVRDTWSLSPRMGALDLALDQLWRLQAADLLGATVYHLAMSAIPRSEAELLGSGPPPLPPGGPGADPLAGAALAAVERYGARVRDERYRARPTPYPGRDHVMEVYAVRREDLYAFVHLRSRGGGEASSVFRVDGRAVEDAMRVWRRVAPGGRGSPWGLLADRTEELTAARVLGEALVPEAIRAMLLSHRGPRPLLRVTVGGDLAAVPWEWLSLDGDTRVLDVADVDRKSVV